MFLITVKAATMFDLRKKLIEAIESMSGESILVQPTQPEDLGYKPVVKVTHDKKAESVVAPAAVPPVSEMPTFHPVQPELSPLLQQNTPSQFVTAMPSFQGHTSVAPPPAPMISQAQIEQMQQPSTAGGEVDARGYAWDSRIHASSKARNKDGTWRTRRGVSEDQVRELQSAQGKPQAPAPAYIPPVPASPMALPPTTPPQWSAPPLAVVPALPPQWTPPPVPQPPVQQAPPIAPVPLAPVPAAAPAYQNVPTPPMEAQKPAHTLETFKDKIVDTFVLLVSTGKIDQHYIEALKAHFKVKEIWDVKDNPAQLSEIFENFVGSGLITRIG